MGLDLIIKCNFERKIQTLTLGARKLLLHKIIYLPEAITTMLWKYSLKYFSEKLNELKLGDDGINTMEKFSGTTTHITLKIISHWYVQFISWVQD